jgi:tight adherence protein B
MRDDFLILLILVGVAAVVLTGFLTIRGLRDRRRDRVRHRLNGQDSSETILLDEIVPEARAEGLAARVDQGFTRMIERASLGLSPAQALLIICLGGLALAGLLYLWRGMLWLALAGAVAGVLLPLGVFAYLQRRWQKQMQEELPDAFFFLARSLRAGLAFDQAIALAGSQGTQPLSQEFRRCAEQINLGLSVPTALQLMANRINLPDFNMLVSVVTLHRATGGNLALLLDRLATSTRDRNQYRGYFRTATMRGRISAIVVGLAVPGFFLLYAVLNPDYVGNFFNSTAGLIALAVAFGLEIIGIIWLYFLLKVNY